MVRIRQTRSSPNLFAGGIGLVVALFQINHFHFRNVAIFEEMANCEVVIHEMTMVMI
jgi:hypothetical protein